MFFSVKMHQQQPLLLLLLVLTILTAIYTALGPDSYAQECANHREKMALEVQSQADGELDFFFMNHYVAPHGVTLVAFGDRITDESLMQETVRRRQSRGWNASLVYVNVTGGCLMERNEQVRSLCRGDRVLASSDHADALLLGVVGWILWERSLIYPCERDATTWFWQAPRCHGNKTIAAIQISMPVDDDDGATVIQQGISNASPDVTCEELTQATRESKTTFYIDGHHIEAVDPAETEPVRYQRKCKQVHQKRLESERSTSHGFLWHVFSSHRIETHRDTYLSLYRWPSSMHHIARSVEALRVCGWNATLIKLRVRGYRRDEGFPRNVCVARRELLDPEVRNALLLSHVGGQYRRIGFSDGGSTAWSERITEDYWEELLYLCDDGGTKEYHDIDVVFIPTLRAL